MQKAVNEWEWRKIEVFTGKCSPAGNSMGEKKRYLKKGRHQHLPDEIQPKTETFLKVQGN